MIGTFECEQQPRHCTPPSPPPDFIHSREKRARNSKVCAPIPSEPPFYGIRETDRGAPLPAHLSMSMSMSLGNGVCALASKPSALPRLARPAEGNHRQRRRYIPRRVLCAPINTVRLQDTAGRDAPLRVHTSLALELEAAVRMSNAQEAKGQQTPKRWMVCENEKGETGRYIEEMKSKGPIFESSTNET